jgi:DNA end-binding protein Ku
MTKTKRRKKKARPHPKHRASWKGPVRFGLVSFEVQAINAQVREKTEFHFHLLHEPDHERIHYAKVCPRHGEVSNDEIVDGYEYSKGHYVTVEKEEIDQLRTDKERALTIDAFVDPAEIDPLYFDGRMYYLVPSGSESQEAYALVAGAMERQERWAVGQVVFSGKEQLVALRPVDGVLIMAMLNYSDEMRKLSEVKRQLTGLKTTRKKLKLAQELIRNWEEDKFDLSRYKDRYQERVSAYLEAKSKGEEIEIPEEEEEPEVINLMEALEKSLGHVGRAARNGRKSKKGRSRRVARRA